MPVRRMDINRIPFIGAYAFCNDKIVLFPKNVHLHPDESSILGVPAVYTLISKSPLLGILLAGNSNAIVCSEFFELEEEEKIREVGVELHHIPGKLTSFGNLVLANDYGAIVSPEFPDKTVKLLEKALQVKVVKSTIAGRPYVGSLGVATNKGVLLHPEVKEEEMKIIEKTLQVPADVGTACGGVSFLGICIIANSRGAVTGSTTTGPELGRIESSLGLME
ncbi:MAG: translation initiation factor IF-6 [Candidatus Hadarchaeales archaeon]